MGYKVETSTESFHVRGVDIDFSKLIFTGGDDIITPPVTSAPSGIRWAPAHKNNYTVMNRTAANIDMVVIHQAEGSYEGCIAWFQSANNDRRTSAHYCISREGEITQLVKIKDKAHHAGNLNSRSIGIEHEGRSTANLFTEVEYQASAMLVRWLAETYTIPLDKSHIVRHHGNCPGPYWNWDYYWQLLLGSTHEGTVQFVQPENNSRVGNPVTFKANVTGDVVKVKYYADDQYFLGESTNKNSQFEVTYNFNGVNRSRNVSVKGYDVDGNFITGAEHRISFTPEDGGAGTVQFVEPIDNGTAPNPTTLKVNVTGDVTIVKYFADDRYVLGESADSSTQFKIEYKFHTTGWRILQAKGYNSEGIAIGEAVHEIRVNILDEPACVNECELEEKGCVTIDQTELSATCQEINGCRRLVIESICPAEDACVDGVCTKKTTGNCHHDCRENSYMCYESARMKCEDFDGDGCFEWHAEELCGDSQECTSSGCQDVVCRDQCTMGEARCSGEYVQECGQFNTDSCMEWGNTTACEVGKTCKNGICVDPSVTCTNKCVAGTVRCSGNKIEVCKLNSTSGCYDYTQEKICATGQVCANGRCLGDSTVPNTGDVSDDSSVDNGGGSSGVDNGGLDTGLGLSCSKSNAIDLSGRSNGTLSLPFNFTDTKDTKNATLRCFDNYPPNELNEGGPEYLYVFTITEAAKVTAWIKNPEPSGTDIDLHLIKSLDRSNPGLIERGHYRVEAVVQPGTYYLSMDTFVSGGVEQKGKYELTVSIQPTNFSCDRGSATDLSGTMNGTITLPFDYTDSKDTRNSTMKCFDNYPPNELNESGPEYMYVFTLSEPARFTAKITDPEPSGTDVDLQLITSINATNPGLITRGDHTITAMLQPGTYYLVMDTYVTDSGEMKGPYSLTVTMRPVVAADGHYFNEYILKAVTYLKANYGLLGYDINSVLTHDIQYGSYGTISQTGVNQKTMCVAAVLEVMLTAMNIYKDETGDTAVFDFLPKRSWERLGSNDIKAHIWVNHSLGSWGSADALVNFGMGEAFRFEDLKPGSMLNLNRTRTGHAVIFLSFLDLNGNEHDVYPTDGTIIVGFKYFSSQGGSAKGAGGFDYRYAIFSKYQTSTFCNAHRGVCDSTNTPKMPGKRDTGVIYSTNRQYLNTGMMLHPNYWQKVRANFTPQIVDESPSKEGFRAFDPKVFDGLTFDDIDYKLKSVEAKTLTNQK
ncbi:N-acetylmuramoyl-L-alanine amidase [bacterium]|nr:N-acetylmuramoyl-L-alanine amidase [bacterium]